MPNAKNLKFLIFLFTITLVIPAEARNLNYSSSKYQIARAYRKVEASTKLKQSADKKHKKKVFRTEIGTELSYVSGLHELWNQTYFSLLYNNEKYGSLMGKVAYGYRHKTSAMLYEISAYPKYKYGYFYLDYIHATKDVYPLNRYAAEGYFNLPQGFEPSIGWRYAHTSDANIRLYTGSIGKYIDRYWFSLRPYISSKDNSILGSVYFTARRYFEDEYHYIGITAGGGRSLDDLDLEDNVTDAIRSGGVWISLNAPFIKGTDLRWYAGFHRDKFPSHEVRIYYDTGVNIRF